MNDDWRIQVDFVEEGSAKVLHDHLEAVELKHDLRKSFHDLVIVTRDGARVYLYAGDRGQAEAAQALIERLAQEQDWGIATDVKRWHSAEEEWRPVDEALPEAGDGKAAEHRKLIEHERIQAEERGYPEFEAFAELPSQAEARELAERLSQEGLQCVRRWKYVAIGATDEDSAKALAERIRAEAPTGSRVTAQGTPQAAFYDLPLIVRKIDEAFGLM
jgi:hypothetical protein